MLRGKDWTVLLIPDPKWWPAEQAHSERGNAGVGGGWNRSKEGLLQGGGQQGGVRFRPRREWGGGEDFCSILTPFLGLKVL